MKLIRTLLPKALDSSVVTIGTFDGLHLGHQSLLTRVKQSAKKLNVPSVVVLFEPRPTEFFCKARAAKRVMNLRDQLIWLNSFGIDVVCLLRFNADLAEQSALTFLNTLHDALQFKQIFLGQDFRFGKARQGDVAFIQQHAANMQYQCVVLDDFKQVQGEKISSTLTRKVLAKGDFEAVEKMLGRSYSLHGRIKHGDKIKTGFPTMNLDMPYDMALSGVFAVKVVGLREQPIFGVANLGMRPTIEGIRRLLEVHAFDFSQQIYGQYIEVVFCQKIRDEKKFSSLDELQKQIGYDTKVAKEIFKI